MFSAFKRLLRERQGLKDFNAVARSERKIVFYSEGGGYWSYFEPVFEALWKDFGQPVLYVTSDDKDAMLHSPKVCSPSMLGKVPCERCSLLVWTQMLC